VFGCQANFFNAASQLVASKIGTTNLSQHE
jgi:hypothetical protein